VRPHMATPTHEKYGLSEKENFVGELGPVTFPPFSGIQIKHAPLLQHVHHSHTKDFHRQ